ncbi:MAG TPA: sugar ABC transporter substrate-binding protein [Patescibacteria group bacterium]|nr:sugar ABC transporter substrate-binding protein [Patescibacteria group bacterium]
MKALSRVLAATAATAVLVGACAAPAATPPAATTTPTAPAATIAPTAPPEPVKLTYFTFSAAPDHLEDLDAIVQAFEQKNPNISIEVQTAAYADYFTKLQTQVAGGSAPDAFELNYENFVSYASAGSLLNLAPLAAADTDFRPEVFYPRAYEVFQADGKQYGLPAQFSVVLLYYNKDLFDAADIAYPDASWTWSEQQAAAEKLTDQAKGVWGVFQPIQFWEFYKVLAQNGGSFFNADGTASTFNDARGVEAANWLIGKLGKTMPADAFGADQDTALFKAGKLGMWHSGIWMFPGLKDAPFRWDVSVEPGNATKAHHFFANAAVASATTAHPAETWAWLRFLTSSDVAVQTRLAAGWELPAVADRSLFETYLAQTPPDNREAVFDALSHIVTPPVIEQQARMTDIVSLALEKARLGQMSVQDALNEAATQVDALLK